jgi:hypothetical protein
VVENPEVFRRAGLLFNEPLGVGLVGLADLLFIQSSDQNNSVWLSHNPSGN